MGFCSGSREDSLHDLANGADVGRRWSVLCEQQLEGADEGGSEGRGFRRGVDATHLLFGEQVGADEGGSSIKEREPRGADAVQAFSEGVPGDDEGDLRDGERAEAIM